jgi:hypothetical protein
MTGNMTKRPCGGSIRSTGAIVRASWTFGLALVASSSIAYGASLTWDSSGNTPTHPQPGSGFWDTNTHANWSNGSTDSAWINGSDAAIPFVAGGYTVTIDDSSGKIIVVFLNPEGNTIAASPGDSLVFGGTFGGGTIFGNGTISAPISGTNGFSMNGVGTVTLSGHSTYTGMTSSGDGRLVLANGASLGNTFIFGGRIIVQGSAQVGVTGGGTAGGTYEPASFFMTDGTIGKFTLNQQAGFHGVALMLGSSGFGATLAFDLSNASADELINSGPGTVSVSGTNIINISTASDPYLTLGDYPLISIPSGGLTGTFDFANGLTTETVTVGGTDYTLELTNTDTTETLSVLPEPTGVAALALSAVLVLRRRRASRPPAPAAIRASELGSGT